MCIDYRALNKLTVKNKWNLPRIDDLLDQLSHAKVFSALDLAQGYHQIRIHPDDVPKTAFCTPFGLYEYKVLSFGLSNAPATFSRVMAETLKEEIRAGFCVVYLDDILVFSNTAEEHLQHLRQVLDKLRLHKFYCKRSKCHFGLTELSYLGFVVSPGHVKVDPKKVEAVSAWPTPQSVHEVRSFLGLANFFRRFIKGFGAMAAPLTALLRQPKKGKGGVAKTKPVKLPADWTPRCDEAFQQIKDALTSAPVLRLPDMTPKPGGKVGELLHPFTVVADACKQGVGAVLLQQGHPVAFESRQFTSTERNYHTGEQELLALVFALEKFRHYVLGTRFTLVTDHEPNTKVQTQSSVFSWTGRKARWAQFLQSYDYELIYKPGKGNVADPLSRKPHNSVSSVLSVLAISTRSNTRAARAAKLAEPSTNPESPPTGGGADSSAVPEGTRTPCYDSTDSTGQDLAQSIRAAYGTDASFRDTVETHKLTERSGFWYKDGLLVVPAVPNLQATILAEAHDCPYAGHLGRLATSNRLRQTGLWWPTMSKDCKRYVDTCFTCQRIKSLNQPKYGKLHPLGTPEDLWYTLSLDWILGLPETGSGHNSLLVGVERLTTYIRLLPTNTRQTAENLAEVFVDEIVKHEGLPAEIVSDRDHLLTSEFWKALTRLLGTRCRLSTAYHKQTDGQNEVMHRAIENCLRAYVSPCLSDWDKHLPMVELALNTRFCERLQSTPFYVCKGRHPRFPLQLQLAKALPQAAEAAKQQPLAVSVVERIQNNVARARELMSQALARLKTREDAHRREHPFLPGNQVWLRAKNLNLKGPRCDKLQLRYVGPYKVVEKVGPVAVRLELPASLKRVHPVFHVDMLKPCNSDGRYQPPPPELVVDETGTHEEFEVEYILRHKDKGRKAPSLWYYVLFKGYDIPEWVRESDLAHSPDLLQEYWSRQATGKQ